MDQLRPQRVSQLQRKMLLEQLKATVQESLQAMLLLRRHQRVASSAQVPPLSSESLLQNKIKDLLRLHLEEAQAKIKQPAVDYSGQIIRVQEYLDRIIKKVAKVVAWYLGQIQ